MLITTPRHARYWNRIYETLFWSFLNSRIFSCKGKEREMILKVRERRLILLYRQMTQQSRHALSRNHERMYEAKEPGERNTLIMSQRGENMGKIKSVRTRGVSSLTVHDLQCASSIKPDWHLRQFSPTLKVRITEENVKRHDVRSRRIYTCGLPEYRHFNHNIRIEICIWHI